MKSNVINKPLRTRNLYDMQNRIKQAEAIGYEMVGKLVETREGTWQCLMRKVVEWEVRD
jgi:hypothetical protein